VTAGLCLIEGESAKSSLHEPRSSLALAIRRVTPDWHGLSDEAEKCSNAAHSERYNPLQQS